MVRSHPGAPMEELVVLVDDQDNVLGTVPKATVHTTHTPLHRGFSVFLFNSQKKVLVTQRAFAKKTFPGVFTNSFCGHPAIGESVEEAAQRRVFDELGIHTINILGTMPYRYMFADNHGIVENEICPVMIATTTEEPQKNGSEVESLSWVTWDEFYTDIKSNPDKYSPWSREEVELVKEKLSVLG